jgi:glucose/arabinose dehydrogenase
VFARSQGGLHDVAVDRDYAQNQTIYFCYAEPADGGGRTTMARARLVEGERPRLDDVRPIFRQQGPLSSGNHFGCRIVQTSDGNLFLTTGDHFRDRDEAQNLRNHIGKTIRVRPDGSVPPDNPFVGRTGARPEIWSYGHRNVQAATLHPETGQLWTVEHGARGGDELNNPQAGKNYGWPVITYGMNYDGTPMTDLTAKEGLEQPVLYWTPSIAVCAIDFYSGTRFPRWKNDLLVSSLASEDVRRLRIENGKVTKQEVLFKGIGRVRDLVAAPDGLVYLALNTPDRVVRLVPVD